MGGGEEGGDGVEEGGLGDGDIALARNVDAGDALPVCSRLELLVRLIVLLFLLAVFRGGHAVAGAPRTGVGAEGLLELDDGEFREGTACGTGGRPGNGGRRRCGEGKRDGVGTQEWRRSIAAAAMADKPREGKGSGVESEG